jgi:hypothetical protein
MADLPDTITLGELCRVAARSMLRAAHAGQATAAGTLELYRVIEIEDPPVRNMLGRAHRVRIRVKVTAASLLHDGGDGLSTKVIDPGGKS